MVANRELLAELNQLVARLHQEGKYLMALQIARYAVLQTKEICGNNHPDYAESLTNLAKLYDSLGEHEKAEPLYIEARQVSGKAQVDNNSEFAAFLNTLSLIHDSFGADEEEDLPGEISSEQPRDMQDDDYP